MKNLLLRIVLEILVLKLPAAPLQRLRKKQSHFASMLPLLFLYIRLEGLEITLGDAWAKSGHMLYSLHYVRLAIDLNFFRDGEWLKSKSEYYKVGEFWESIGGSWGGRFHDGGHFSLAHMGRK